MGNTCWASSTLQMLATCEEVPIILQQAEDTNRLDPKLRKLFDILKLLRVGNNCNLTRDLNKGHLKRALIEFLDQFYTDTGVTTSERGRQMCSKAFIGYLMTIFCTLPPLAKLFTGTYQKTKACNTCGTRTCGPMEDYTGEPIRANPYVHAVDMQNELARATLNEQDAYDVICESPVCKGAKRSHKLTNTIHTIPTFSFISIQRNFRVGTESDQRVWTAILNANRSVTVVISGSTSVVKLRPMAWQCHIPREDSPATAGHYVTYTKGSTTYHANTHPQFGVREGRYYLFDDEWSHEIDDAFFDTQQIHFSCILYKAKVYQTTGNNLVEASLSLLKRKTPAPQPEVRPKKVKNNLAELAPADTNNAKDNKKEKKNKQEKKSSAAAPTNKHFENAITNDGKTRHFTNCRHFLPTRTVVPGSNKEVALNASGRMEGMTWNTRSLRCAWAGMSKQNVKPPWKNADIDCLCLTEVQAPFLTILKQTELMASLDEFAVLLWSVSNAQDKAAHAGVLLAFKKRPMSLIWKIGDPASDLMGRVVGARFADCTVVGVYAKSLIAASEERSQFDQAFAGFIATERQTRSAIYIVGDLNTPLFASELPSDQPWHQGAAYDFVAERTHLATLLKDNGLKDAATHHAYTWHWKPKAPHPPDSGIGLRLDYLIGPISQKVTAYTLHGQYRPYSDHIPVSAVFMNMTLACEEPLSASEKGIFHQILQCPMPEDKERLLMIKMAMIIRDQDALPPTTIVRRLQTYETPASSVRQVLGDEYRFAKTPKHTTAPAPPKKAGVFEEAKLHVLRYLAIRQKQPHPPRVRVFLGKCAFFHNVLLDSGSDLCLIDSTHLLKQCPAGWASLVRSPGAVTLGDNETQLEIYGHVLLTIGFPHPEGKAHIRVRQKFFVLSKLPECLIIGDALFIDQNKREAKMDLHRRAFSIDGLVVPFTQSHTPHLELEVAASVLVPAESSVSVEVHAPHDGSFHGVVHDKCRNVLLQVETSPLLLQSGSGRVNILNHDSEPVFLPQGYIVACVQGSPTNLVDKPEPSGLHISSPSATPSDTDTRKNTTSSTPVPTSHTSTSPTLGPAGFCALSLCFGLTPPTSSETEVLTHPPDGEVKTRENTSIGNLQLKKSFKEQLIQVAAAKDSCHDQPRAPHTIEAAVNDPIAPKKKNPGNTPIKPLPDSDPELEPLWEFAREYGLPKVAPLLRELMELPRCAIEDAPNYFTDGALDPDKLPDFLKDLQMRREDITVSEQEMSACIYIACVLPEGRSKAFT